MSTNNQKGLGGLLSNKVRLRTVNNRLELVKPEKRKDKPLSPELEAFREKFVTASRYASRMIKDDQSRAEYAKGINKQKRTAFQVAFSDFIIAPKITLINAAGYTGSVGSTIVVKAVDDFKVTKVTVSILDSDGYLIEQGDAEQGLDNTSEWTYTATVDNPTREGTTIQVIAYDRPGNKGTREVTL